MEETGGKTQGAERGQQHRQVGDLRLQTLPFVQPGRADAKQADDCRQLAELCGCQPQATGCTGVGKAHQVVGHQHAEAAEQQAEQQRAVVIGDHLLCALQGDAGAQRVFRCQAQVDIQRLLGFGQRQEEITAGQRATGERQVAAGVRLFDQFIALQHVEIEVGQVGGEHPQHLCVSVGGEAVMQPQGAGAARGVELGQVSGAELRLLCGTADVIELQCSAGVDEA